MAKEVEQLLAKGLLAGYAGKGEITPITRASIPGKASHLPLDNGFYHDEWFTPSYLGGGQEFAQVGNEALTRLYGGGTPDPEFLATLGLTPKDVGEKLKEFIKELGDKTRLYDDCRPEPKGDWQYVYEVLLKDSRIPVIVAVESIFYQQIHRVHLHPFIISPLK